MTAPVSQISHGKNLVKFNRIKEVIFIESIKIQKFWTWVAMKVFSLKWLN